MLWMVRSRFFLWFSIPAVSFSVFGYCCECINNNWYHRHFHFPQLFSSLTIFRYLSVFWYSFIYTSWSAKKVKSTRLQVLFFLLTKTSFDQLSGIEDRLYLRLSNIPIASLQRSKTPAPSVLHMTLKRLMVRLE